VEVIKEEFKFYKFGQFKTIEICWVCLTLLVQVIK